MSKKRKEVNVMKKLSIIPIIILAIILLAGCDLSIFTPDLEEPIDVLSADVIVVDWEQLVIDEEYDDEISIEYLITNTGTVDIDFSKILFKIIYGDIDKDEYYVWIDGVAVDVGCYESGYATGVWVGNRKVVDVVPVEWKLASYDL